MSALRVVLVFHGGVCPQEEIRQWAVYFWPAKASLRLLQYASFSRAYCTMIVLVWPSVIL